LYAGSVLLHPAPVGFVLQLVPVSGWVMVKGGHCTRNDWALAVITAKETITARKQRLFTFLFAIRPTSTADPGGCSIVAVTAALVRIQALTVGNTAKVTTAKGMTPPCSPRNDKRCQTLDNSIQIYAKSQKSRLISWPSCQECQKMSKI
jgi:hypothetical protein